MRQYIRPEYLDILRPIQFKFKRMTWMILYKNQSELLRRIRGGVFAMILYEQCFWQHYKWRISRAFWGEAGSLSRDCKIRTVFSTS